MLQLFLFLAVARGSSVGCVARDRLVSFCLKILPARGTRTQALLAGLCAYVCARVATRACSAYSPRHARTRQHTRGKRRRAEQLNARRVTAKGYASKVPEMPAEHQALSSPSPRLRTGRETAAARLPRSAE